MKKQIQTRIAVLALCIILVLTLVSCNSDVESSAATGSSAAARQSASESSSGIASISEEGMLTITDMAGREVTYPSNPERVFSSSPAAEPWLAALVPERMIGWANKMSGEQLSYYPKEVADIPLVGGWYGYTEGNAEGIVTMAPDVVISSGDVSSPEGIESSVLEANELEQKLGIPVIYVSYALEDAPEVMRLLGEWMGVAERGTELGDYMQTELDKVKESVAKVPAGEVVTYYYAEDSSGLMTESADSFHAEVFIYCGLECVSNVAMSSFMGREQVSMEQVINWDPEYIFTFSPAALKTIRNDSEWSNIQAVKDRNVYYCVDKPQNWFDRSPNSLRVLGCLYTAAICYPDYVTYDLDTEIGEYFRKVYNCELTIEQIHALYQV